MTSGGCGAHRWARMRCPRYDQMTGDGSRVGCGRRTCGLSCAARAGSSRQAGGRRYGLILNGPARRPVSHLRRSGRGIPAAERSSTTSGALLGRTARFLFRALHDPRRARARVLRATLPRPSPRRREMAIQVAPEHMSAEEIVALCREHSLYEWSAQGAVDPIPVDRAEGVYFYSPDGTRYLDFNSQLMSVNIGHGDRRVIDAIARADAEAGLRQPVHGHRAACPAGCQAGGDLPRRHRRLLLHQRRRRGERERHQARPPVHRSPEDHDPLSLLSRRDRPGHRGHRRSRVAGRPRPASRASCASRTSIAGRARIRSPWSRACATSRRSSCSRARRPSRPSWSRPSWAPTASSSRPTATCRACGSCATATASCSSPTRS